MGNYALQLSEIIDETLKVLADFKGAGSDGFRWTRSDVTFAIKQMYLDLARETSTIFGTDSITLVEGTYVYALPSDCIYPTRIGLDNGSFYIILPMNLTEEVDMIGSLYNTEGVPDWFYRETLDFNQIGVIPTPGASAASDSTLEITYVRTPTNLADEADYPDSGLPEFLQKDIKYGAAALLLNMTTDQLLMYKARIFMGKWIGRVNAAKEFQLSPTTTEGAVPL